MDSPLLMPQSHIYGNRNPVRLLDSDGTIVCLPFQLNIPFCRMVARESLTRIKRWTIAPIYRTLPSGGVRQFRLCTFRPHLRELILVQTRVGSNLTPF